MNLQTIKALDPKTQSINYAKVWTSQAKNYVILIYILLNVQWITVYKGIKLELIESMADKKLNYIIIESSTP